MAKSRKKIIIGSIVVIVVLLMVIMLLTKKNGHQGLTVQTEKVERHKIVETVTATGRIQPQMQVKISADVAAKITRLGVEEGDWVEKGDFLVQLDRERFNADVERAEASLRSAESNALLAKENMHKAEKDFDRTKELFEKSLESEAAMDQTYAAAQVEKARYRSSLEMVEQSRAALKQARDYYSKTTIYAPMSGTISELNKEVGEIALGSQFQEDVIMIVSNLSGMEALVNVDENDVVSVSLGDSATIEVDALPNQVFHGVISEIASSATISGMGTTDQKTEFEVKISILDPSSELRPGMTASSDIVTETRADAIGVPIQCVTVRTPEQLNRKPAAGEKGAAIADSTTRVTYVPDKDGFVEVVFIIVDGKAKAKQVTSGIQSETHIEIIEGVSEDDEIITGSYRAISETLQNHMSVTAQNAGK
ncbi:MAG: efflux RND transporter periplasmic adaptor subunit [candidate division KSB1 bacterium]|nr:efflux RND transporter periplasmic adaptor subunit [candidate division KSB1 bacterium]